MNDKLKISEKINIRAIVILSSIILALTVSFFSYSFYMNNYYGTNPVEIIERTSSSLDYKQSSNEDFNSFYSKTSPDSVDSRISDIEHYQVTLPTLEYDYRFYDYNDEYYNRCNGKRKEFLFTDPKQSNFNFNYQNRTFDYSINVFQDLYLFSSDLKNEDCYFDTDKYTEGYLEDPYNNNFVDRIADDFISLRNDGYSDDEIVEIATIFVQSIEYGTDEDDINRYPYETIFEETGNCLDKSVILVGILKKLGYTSYIVIGDIYPEYHALVAIECDEGNVIHDNKNLCYIETTAYTPISTESDIVVEKFVPASSGDKIYSDVSYGKTLLEEIELSSNNINYLEDRLDQVDNELNSINSDISYYENQLASIEAQMCTTDCVTCFDDSILYYSVYCDDANRYNRYVRDYNNVVEESSDYYDNYNTQVEYYNSILIDWYREFYYIEELMFSNPELLERLR